jgi:hypothetical protein
MPQWGIGLLALYVVLGVSGAKWRKAGHVGLALTAAVLLAVFAKYGGLR